MNVAGAPAYQHTPFSSGVDWITASAKRGLSGRSFHELQDEIIQTERAAGRDVSPAALRDYTGHRGEGWFVGIRKDSRLIIASGGRAPALWGKVAQTAHNVSRLDLQVSVWTHGEQPELAREAYQKMRHLPNTRGRPRALTLIQSHPAGETLNVGRRSSDSYGRLYDWASAHGKGEPRTIWRYEVEYKRDHAGACAEQLLAAAEPATLSAQLVHCWFNTRGLRPTFPIEESAYLKQLPLKDADRDTLGWIEASLRVTIAKQINRYGLPRVLDALGLSHLVQPIVRRTKTHATDPARPVPPEAARRDSRAADGDGLSLHDARHLDHNNLLGRGTVNS